MLNEINHNIKHRKKPNNEFYTPIDLAKLCINQIPTIDGDVLLDSAYGTGNFFKNFPDNTINLYTKDFFNCDREADWIITNPPYSCLDKWLEHTCRCSKKGFGLLLGWNNLTARRIETANKFGFGLSRITMFKVFKWFGMSCFVVFEKDKKNIIGINRKVWRG